MEIVIGCEGYIWRLEGVIVGSGGCDEKVVLGGGCSGDFEGIGFFLVWVEGDGDGAAYEQRGGGWSVHLLEG